MASYSDGDGGGNGGDHRPQYLCNECSHIFSPFPSPPRPSSDLFCPICNGDSINELQTQMPISTTIRNSPFSNIPPEVAAAFAAAPGGVTTLNFSFAPTTVSWGGQPIDVPEPVSATVQLPVSDIINGNFEQQIGQALMNAWVLPGGVAPPPPASNSENIESDSEEEDVD